jgi:hypothetical protein
MVSIRTLLLSCSIFLLVSLPAQAVQWVDVGSANYRFLFKTITTASLAVPAKLEVDDWLSPAYPKRLRIDYGMAVSAERLSGLFMETIEASYGADLLGQRALIEAFVDAFKTVEKGDYYQLQWADGELLLSLNQQSLHRLNNPQVAKMLLSVWMGEQPISRKQRRLLYVQWLAYQQQLASEG